MEAKEKAIELVEKYRVESWVISRDHDKQCALIAVDEIINSNPHSNPFNTNVFSTMEFWQEVKIEIEKL